MDGHRDGIAGERNVRDDPCDRNRASPNRRISMVLQYNQISIQWIEDVGAYTMELPGRWSPLPTWLSAVTLE